MPVTYLSFGSDMYVCDTFDSFDLHPLGTAVRQEGATPEEPNYLI